VQAGAGKRHELLDRLRRPERASFQLRSRPKWFYQCTPHDIASQNIAELRAPTRYSENVSYGSNAETVKLSTTFPFCSTKRTSIRALMSTRVNPFFQPRRPR
jgi:hypothetical protein